MHVFPEVESVPATVHVSACKQLHAGALSYLVGPWRDQSTSNSLRSCGAGRTAWLRVGVACACDQ